MTRSMPALLLVFVISIQANKEEAIDLAQNTIGEKEQSTSEHQVMGAESAEWPDTSLGCPVEGMMYAQVLTPGYRVLIRADDRIYQVHVGGGRAAICKEPIQTDVVSTLIDDLAKKKDAERSAIEILRAEPVIWNDSSLGCPRPEGRYIDARVEGYRVILKYGGKSYDYRVSKSREFLVCEKSTH